MGNKGLMTKEVESFFGSLIIDKLPLRGFGRLAAKLGVPMLIRIVDDNYSDKIPEPWRTHAENLIGVVYVSLKDGVVTKEEVDGIISEVTVILNEEIDIPKMDEPSEQLLFQTTLQLIAGFVFHGMQETKKEL